MTTTHSPRRPFVAAALLALAAGAASPAPMAASAPVAPSSMSKARPAVVDKAVRRDPYARRKSRPRTTPRDPSEFDALRIGRAESRRSRRRARQHGSTTIRRVA